MSLVQAVITKKYLLLGADQRAIKKDIIKENCNKIIKINDEIMFGCTGGAIDNSILFEGFCGYNEDIGYYNLDKSYNDLTYKEFVSIIRNQYNQMYSEHKNTSNLTKYHINSIVCGYNNSDFEITTFSMNTSYTSDGIRVAKRNISLPFFCISLGDEKHFKNLDNTIGLSFLIKSELELSQCKEIMKNVIQKGSTFDKTINSNVNFEVIYRR